MTSNASLLMYFIDASLTVKIVMLLLLSASLLSWTIIIARTIDFKRARKAFIDFDALFWSGAELPQLYEKLKTESQQGLSVVFLSGFTEYMKQQAMPHHTPEYSLAAVERAMRVASVKEMEQMERHVPLLASIGSVSPYVGLFGTVWGIMASFHALGNVQHATIAMVAPGISEALVATAMGLFAAIPAVLAYNRLSSQIAMFEQGMVNFQDEFTNLVSRQLQTKS